MVKRDRFVILFTAAALILASPVAYAYPGDGHSPEKKSFWGKEETGHEALYKELKLTDEQKKLLEENRKTHREEARAMFDEMRQKRALMKEELQKDSLDMAKINSINQDLKALQAKMLDHRLERILEVRKILTPEQFKKFLEKTGQRRGHSKNR